MKFIFNLLKSYIKLRNNIFLGLYLSHFILLYINLLLMLNFQTFLLKIYPIFLARFIIIAKNIRISKKQIKKMLKFAYIKYRVLKMAFKSYIPNLQ